MRADLVARTPTLRAALAVGSDPVNKLLKVAEACGGCSLSD